MHKFILREETEDDTDPQFNERSRVMRIANAQRLLQHPENPTLASAKFYFSHISDASTIQTANIKYLIQQTSGKLKNSFASMMLEGFKLKHPEIDTSNSFVAQDLDDQSGSKILEQLKISVIFLLRNNAMQSSVLYTDLYGHTVLLHCYKPENKVGNKYLFIFDSLKSENTPGFGYRESCVINAIMDNKNDLDKILFLLIQSRDNTTK